MTATISGEEDVKVQIELEGIEYETMEQKICKKHNSLFTHFDKESGMLLCDSCLSDGIITNDLISIGCFCNNYLEHSSDEIMDMRKRFGQILKQFKQSYNHHKLSYDLMITDRKCLEIKKREFKKMVGEDIRSMNALINKMKEKLRLSESSFLKVTINKIVKMKINQKLFQKESMELEDELVRVAKEVDVAFKLYNWYYQKVLIIEHFLSIDSLSSPFDYLSAYILDNYKNYLREPFCIDTKIETFRAFTGVNLLDEVQEVYKKQLVSMANGVKISQPVRFNNLKTKSTRVFASVSHNGIFSSNLVESDSMFLEFINLFTDQSISFKTKTWSMTGFYDDNALILSEGNCLLEGTVDSIFKYSSLKMFRSIRNAPKISEYTDVSLLHATRKLIYASYKDCVTCIYDVDNKKIEKLNTEREAFEYASMTGIKTGVRGILKECGNSHNTCTLNYDGSTTCLLEHNQNYLCVVLPSISQTRNLNKALKLYSDGFFFLEGTKSHKFKGPITFKCNVSIIRLYSDVFLMFDKKKEEWNVVRIVVP